MVAVSRLILAVACLTLGCESDQSAPDRPTDTATPASPTALTRTPAPPGAVVFIIAPVDGSTVSSPVQLKFGISGMEVAPSGDFTEGTGHHHLLVDAELQDASLPIPTSDSYLHFGKGQTETSLELDPGPHTLRLVLGDGAHVPHDPPVMSEPITITVE